MDASQVHAALTELGFPQRFLQREIAILQKKKTAKRDPYDVLKSILLYLYCTQDRQRFVTLFQSFIASDLDSHFTKTFDLWSYVEGCLLLHADLTGDGQYLHLIREKGFVEDRVDGGMLNLASKNLKAELGELDLGHSLPKPTIMKRYQALIVESLVSLHLHTGTIDEAPIRTRLDRYVRLYLAAVDNYEKKDPQFVAALKEVADELT